MPFSAINNDRESSRTGLSVSSGVAGNLRQEVHEVVPPSLPFPLEVGSLKYRKRVWGSAVSCPSGVWGGAPAEIKFDPFQA